MTSKTRNSHVDVLRGIAILLVLLLHFTLGFGIKNSIFASLLGLQFARALIFNGNYGVTLFFVISGYLICSMSISRWGSLEHIKPRDFYTYRFARIAPSLLLVLGVIVLLGCLNVPYFSNSDDGHHLPSSFFIVAVASVLTFWHNVLMQSQGWFNYCLNIYWSLSVEEVFYVALPAVCLTLGRKWLFVLACLALIVYAPIYRAQHIDNGLYWECGYAACFDAIALGCLAALLSQRWRPTRPVAACMRAAAALGFALTYLRGIDGHEVFGFTLIALCAATYLLASTRDTAPSPAIARLTGPLRWFGQHSYELYLFHIVILALMRNVFARGELAPWSWTLWFALFLTLSTLVAFLVARFVSEPANRAIRRFSVGAHATQVQA
ncbi:MAG: acyltransferase [Pseudomonadota bacterium]